MALVLMMDLRLKYLEDNEIDKDLTSWWNLGNRRKTKMPLFGKKFFIVMLYSGPELDIMCKLEYLLT